MYVKPAKGNIEGRTSIAKTRTVKGERCHLSIMVTPFVGRRREGFEGGLYGWQNRGIFRKRKQLL